MSGSRSDEFHSRRHNVQIDNVLFCVWKKYQFPSATSISDYKIVIKTYKHTMTTLLAEWVNRQGGPLHSKLSILNNRLFDDPKDAEILCAALGDPRAKELDDDVDSYFPDMANPAWFTIAWKMYRVDSEAVRSVIQSQGLPILKDNLEYALSEAAIWEPISDHHEDEYRCLNGEPRHFLFLISLLAIYSDKDSVIFAAKAARHHRFMDGGDLSRTLGNWPKVFQCFLSHDQHAKELLELLREPLPSGDVAEGYLIFSNFLAEEGRLGGDHPFDTPSGMQRLLQMGNEEEGDVEIDDPRALFVVEALQYLSGPGLELLKAKLSKHRNENVKKALWHATN